MPNKTRKKRKPSTITFKDYPEFTPNLTPQQIFQLGSFGGTYWRPIYSKTNKRNYKNVHKKFLFLIIFIRSNSVSDTLLPIAAFSNEFTAPLK